MPAQREQGTTLVEVAVAGALLVLALASLYALYGTTVKEAKAGDTAMIAAAKLHRANRSNEKSHVE